MNSGKYVFPQLFQFIDRYEFEKCVDRYDGEYRTRSLNCWNQFIQLFFGQLTSLNSLRDVCTCLGTHNNKLYHLGIKQYVNQSTLPSTNERSDWRIFAVFGSYPIKKIWGQSEHAVKHQHLVCDLHISDLCLCEILIKEYPLAL